MKTLFTTEDMKNIIDSAFNGNLWQYKATKGAIDYNNPNGEEIVLIDETTGEKEVTDIAEYLNIKFYDWKYRVESIGQGISVFDDFAKSLNNSMKSSFGLVEFLGENAIASPDIDSATDNGIITLLIQTNKIKNFDYYARKVRNAFLGKPQEFINSQGENLTAFIVLGLPRYEEEPTQTQLGECLVVTMPFSISYMTSATTYSDSKYELSLDGETFYDIKVTRLTWQEVITTNAVPRTNRPDMAGFLGTARSSLKTIAYNDYKKGITAQIKDLFMSLSAIEIDGVVQERKEVNIPLWIKVTDNDTGKVYLYKDLITEMERVIVNNDFVTASIMLKGWGK